MNNDISLTKEMLDKGGQQIFNGGNYDFLQYIFHGILTVKEGENKVEYDFWVTTGDVPIVTINTGGEAIPNYPKIGCSVQLLSSIDLPNYSTEDNDSLIEVRGGSSRFSQKTSYSFKYKRELSYDIEEKLLDMTNARKWILTGCFCDRILMRDKLSYDLFNQLRDSEHYDYAAQTRHVELYINDEYRGVYLLTERVDEDLLKLADYSEEDIVHSVVYKASSLATNWQRWNPWTDSKPYDKLSETQGYLQKEPNPDNPEQGVFWDPLLYIREFAIKSTDTDFIGGIADKLDLNNAIDYHLHALVTGNWIAIQSNRYICRDNSEDSKFFYVPWDYNISFGRTSNTYKQEITTWFTNKILSRLMEIEFYQVKFKQRWNELYGNVFSADNICKQVDENARFLESAQDRNFKKFPVKVGDNPLNDEYIDNYGFDEELDYVKQWAENRLKFLNFYINDNQDLSELKLNYNIIIFIDNPASGGEVPGDFEINGWSINTQEKNSTGISKIEIYYNDIGEEGLLIGEAEYNMERENVAKELENENYLNSGFRIEVKEGIMEKGKNTFFLIAYDYVGKYNIIPVTIYYNKG